MLYYVPLEPVAGRYTEQWSRASTGWIERALNLNGVQYERVAPAYGHVQPEAKIVKNDTVYNLTKRGSWAFDQSKLLANKILSGVMSGNDWIYFDDMWHPGLELVVQAKASVRQSRRPRLAAFCHAQSVDKWDFMAEMSNTVPEIRQYEAAMAASFDVLFVNSTMLADLLTTTFTPNVRVVRVGHVYSTDEVWEMAGRTPTNHNQAQVYNNKEQVAVFSSRLDKEKRPEAFIDLAMAYRHGNPAFPKVEFRFLTGYETLRSYNNPSIVRRIKEAEKKGYVTVYTGLSKREYYRHLMEAKYHVSCSLQDWTSFCLLEALTFFAYPVYPNYRSFPEAFGIHSNLLYPFHENMNKREASDCLYNTFTSVASKGIGFQQLRNMYEDIVEPHNDTVFNMLKEMK